MSDSWIEEMKASDEYRQAQRRSLDHLKACSICTPFKRCPERKALLQAEVEIANKFRQGNVAPRLKLIGRAEKGALTSADSLSKEQAHRPRAENSNRPPSGKVGEGGQMRTSATPLHDKAHTPLHDKAQRLVNSRHRNIAGIEGLTSPELEQLIKQLKLAERQNFIEIRRRANENAVTSPRGVVPREAKRRAGKGSRKSKARSK